MKVQVCSGKSCKNKFSQYIITRLNNDAEFYAYKNLEVEEDGCMGECKKWPCIRLKNQTINYVNPAKASEIITKHMQEDLKTKKISKK